MAHTKMKKLYIVGLVVALLAVLVSCNRDNPTLDMDETLPAGSTYADAENSTGLTSNNVDNDVTARTNDNSVAAIPDGPNTLTFTNTNGGKTVISNSKANVYISKLKKLFSENGKSFEWGCFVEVQMSTMSSTYPHIIYQFSSKDNRNESTYLGAYFFDETDDLAVSLENKAYDSTSEEYAMNQIILATLNDKNFLEFLARNNV